VWGGINASLERYGVGYFEDAVETFRTWSDSIAKFQKIADAAGADILSDDPSALRQRARQNPRSAIPQARAGSSDGQHGCAEPLVLVKIPIDATNRQCFIEYSNDSQLFHPMNSDRFQPSPTGFFRGFSNKLSSKSRSEKLT
jgi:hypothetical protein